MTVRTLLCLALVACGGKDDADGPDAPGLDADADADADTDSDDDADTDTDPPQPACDPGTPSGAVAAPVFVRNLTGQTSWFAGPAIVDLDGDGANELVAAYYSLFVFDGDGALLDQHDGGEGRIYAPHVIADLDGDGVTEIAYGSAHEVHVVEWRDGALQPEPGWPADTTTAGQSPEVRGMAAGDLDRDGTIEVVVTTTQTQPTSKGGAQVFAFTHDGRPFQPAGGASPAWPRYNTADDADRNGMGHAGFGCYGLNVGIGDLDDDPELEVLATYDNHHIQLFDHDGVAHDASDFYTNRASEFADERLTWGQFIRWADPQIEEDHYHLHAGEWPHPDWAEWLQWTASPPSVADLDGDGLAEVIGVPNVEENVPYDTVAYAVMVLEGSHGDGSRSARRKAGWETLPRGGAPVEVDGWYPPGGVPSPVPVDLTGDGLPEIVASLNDGRMHAFGPDGTPLWSTDYTDGKAILYASEPMVVDLNQDGVPEILFSTFGDPDVTDSGRLVILDASGAVLHDVALPNPGSNGNGSGAPAPPGIGDLDGDGQLEVVVQTFDHGMDVFTVPGSATNCLLWPTARGSTLRQGRRP